MTSPAPRRQRPYWLLPIALLATASCKDAGAPAIARADPARSVRVTHVRTRAGDIGLTASGLLVPHESFAATGDVPGIRVAQILAREGMFVDRGQVLAVLDDTLIRSQIAQQQAVIAQQRTVVRQAQAEAARAQPLDGVGILSAEAVQARGFKADTATAALNVQEAQLRDLRTRAARLQVRAPVAGRVIEATVRVGDVSGSPQPMFTIVPGGTIELQVQVPESRLAQLRPGMPAAVTLADGTLLDGRVVSLGTRIDRQSAQGDVRLGLRPVAGAAWVQLRPGASGTARFAGAGRAASAVPEAAVQYDTGGASLMVLDTGNRVHRVPIRTGTRDGGFVTLVDGPPPGTPVLAASAAFVTDGDPVTPVFARE